MSVSVGDTIDRYRIEDEIAEGDFVRVFRAVSEVDGAVVALKIMQPDIKDAEVLRRFEREARIAQRVEHPNLITVLDRGPLRACPT